MNIHSPKSWHEKAAALKLEGRNFIDGDYRPARSGALFESINPANGEVLATVARSGADDVDDAVASARKAFRSGVWSRMAPRARMAILYRFADLIESHADDFALTDTLDMGKPISEMTAIDVPASVTTFRFTAEMIDKVEGKVTATPANALQYIKYQPLGVVACIVPWNYPLLMTAWKIAPALAAGNSVVLKPAEQSPLSALLLARLFVEAGGPPGVLNVVNGFGEEAGKPLALHMDVEKIAFTGSAEIGKLMFVYAGQSNMKKVATECGGKSPHVVLADVSDIEIAAKTAAMGIFGNQGEVCCAGSRILVDRKIQGDFLDALLAETRSAYVVGDPLDPATTVGPLVTASHQSRVLSYIDIGKAEGAQCLIGGGRPADFNQGAYVAPTVFAGVDNGMRIAREEIFGPVASVIPIDGIDDAITIGNDTPYGLASGIWTSDIGKALRFAEESEAGMVYINGYMGGDMTMPFGGWKESGNGRDKHADAILSYMQMKAVWITLG